MDLNYDQFNGDTLIFKYNLDEYGNPISIKVDNEARQVSVHGTIQLEYVPDEYNRVVMLNEDNTQMTEVFNRDEIKPNTYYIDYNNGVAYLDKSQFGKTKIYNYYNKGLQLIGCSRIYDEHDVSGKHVVLTLQEIIDAGREALRFLLDIGDAKKVIEKLETLIAEGKVTITNIENAITKAEADKNEIVQEIQDNIQQAKDEVINVRGNKEILVQSSQWTLNGDVYEKEITHDLNSENLHVTAKNSNTKEAVTIGYKILDKSRILLKSDEAINMSVILSASYYHATQTISDDIAEEVVKARKGEVDLKTKIDSIDEQLEHNTKQMISKRVENVFGNNKCILHRGACTVAPEQTVASFQFAKKLGVKVVEIDVWKTADNDFAIFHDSTLDDKTNGTGKVESKTLSELKSLIFTKGANLDKYPNLKILSFDECMKLLNELGLNALIDFKTYTLDSSIYSALIEKIKNNGMLNRVAIATWYGSQIKVIRDLEKDICLGIEQVGNEAEWNFILNNNIDFAFLTKGTYLTESNIKRLHNNYRYCIGFGVNTLNEIKTYDDYGCDYFVTDNIFNGGV